MRRTGPIKIRYTLTRKTTGRKANRQRSCGISQAEAMRIQNEINSARHDLINAQVAAEEVSKEVAAKAPEIIKAVEQVKPTPEADNNYSIFDFEEVITDGLSKMKAQADKMRNFKFDPNQFLTSLGESCDTLIGSASEAIIVSSANDDELVAGGDEVDDAASDEKVSKEFNIDYEFIRELEGIRDEGYVPIDWFPTEVAPKSYRSKKQTEKGKEKAKKELTLEKIKEAVKAHKEEFVWGKNRNLWIEVRPIAKDEKVPDHLKHDGKKIVGVRVPFGNSGVTIATGFDIGQQNEADLKRFGLEEALIEKFKPYLGKKRMDAVRKLKDKALNITKEQAKAIDLLVKDKTLNKLETMYNQATANNETNVKFKALPKAAQTVILSVAHQFGGNLPVNTPKFWCFVTNQKWGCVIKELKDFGGSTKERRDKEAKRLEKNITASERNEVKDCKEFYNKNCKDKEK